MKRVAILITVIALITIPSAKAQDVPGPPRIMIPMATNKPSILQNVGIDQRLGDSIPPGLVFNDENGNPVRIGDYFGHRPMILALVYYQCPMLCTMVMNDLVRTMRSMPESVGKDFDVLTVSFDPRDKPAVARIKEETYLAQYDRKGAAAGWHFLTGDAASIAALTEAVGFRYTWDAKNQMYAHASGIMVLTPDGKLSRYFFGIDYAPKDVRLALNDATGGHIGGLADAVLFYCFCYDPATGKYGLAIARLLKVGGVLTILCLGGFVVTMLRRERHDAQARPEAAK